MWALNWGSWGTSTDSHLPCPLQSSNLWQQHKGTAESNNLVNIPITTCQKPWVRVPDMNMLSGRWWKICDAFYSCLKIMSRLSGLCAFLLPQAHHFSSFLPFTLPLQLIHLEQNPAHFCCQSSWSAQCSLRVTFLFFFFFWSVVNWINPLPSSIAIDSHFSEAVSLPQRAEPLHKLNSSCARARPKKEPQAFWNASQCVKQLSTQPACPVL